MNLDNSVRLTEISELTENKNGAELKAICTEAGMFAIRSERNIVTHNDFLKAIDKVSVEINQHPRFSSFDGAMFA